MPLNDVGFKAMSGCAAFDIVRYRAKIRRKRLRNLRLL